MIKDVKNLTLPNPIEGGVKERITNLPNLRKWKTEQVEERRVEMQI